MKRLLLAAMLATFALSATATAHDHGRGNDKADKHHWKAHQKAGKAHEKAYRKAVKEQDKAYRRWARGQYIPASYRSQQYYIDDYRAYHLDAPPRGYRWVRPYEEDDTYYLVEIATGLISQIFGN